jgi:HAD superfamily hydrolase (TIGR01509 family)
VSQRRFDAVVFDNDGLLLDTEAAWTRAERRLWARRGRTFTLEDKRVMLGSAGELAQRNLETLLEAPGEGEALFRELQGLALEEIGVQADPQPGAVALLARLREEGIPLGLASNSNRDFVERALATAGVALATFDAILTGDEVPSPKPAPDIYLLICEELGVSPKRTAVLEDSPTGVAAAVAAGCFVIGIASLAGVVLDQADLAIDSLAHVPF